MKRRLLAGMLVSIVAGLITAFAIAMPFVGGLYKDQMRSRLDAILALLAQRKDELANAPQSFADRAANQISAMGQHVRITVLDTEGNVLGDSEGSSYTYENHADRPEVIAALSGEVGYDIRKSETIGVSFYYAAMPAGDYIVRAAIPLSDIERMGLVMWTSALVGVAAGGVLAFAIAFVSSRRILRPIEELTEAAKAISGGNLEVRAGRYGNEAGQLAEAFNRMTESLKKALEDSERKRIQLKELLECMDDGVISLDEEGRVVFSNDRFAQLTDAVGIGEGQTLGDGLLLRRIAGIASRTAKEGAPQRESMTLGYPEERYVEVYSTPINSGGVLMVLTDMTRLRKLERLRSDFVANVTHELKTPLTAIRGFVELLKEGKRDEKTAEYIYNVLDIESERLRNLIDDILQLSEIENTREEINVVSLDVRQVLADIAERMLPLAARDNISIELDVPEGLRYGANRVRFEQLFGNLINNAVKYNKPGGKVHISAYREKGLLIVKVRDTGIGIAPEHHDRLFERFYRVDGSRSRELGGTGLGLSIVKHIVNLYGGDISVASAPGAGSEFTVRLPYRDSAQAQ